MNQIDTYININTEKYDNTDQYLLKVVSSDGFNSASNISNPISITGTDIDIHWLSTQKAAAGEEVLALVRMSGDWQDCSITAPQSWAGVAPVTDGTSTLISMVVPSNAYPGDLKVELRADCDDGQIVKVQFPLSIVNINQPVDSEISSFSDEDNETSSKQTDNSLTSSEFSLKFSDSDGDGVLDRFDNCPSTTGVVEVDGNGCASVAQSSSGNGSISSTSSFFSGTQFLIWMLVFAIGAMVGFTSGSQKTKDEDEIDDSSSLS